MKTGTPVAAVGEMSAQEAISSRRCVRAFLEREVPRDVIESILEIASRAPSGSNIQPWQVIVLTGDAKARLSNDLYARSVNGDQGAEEYNYYPKAWREPYLARRRKVGWDLYGSLNIGRGDKQRMAEQLSRNYLFFGAPVGMFFTIDRDMEVGSWLDYGMFIENIMIAARIFGLDTCPQQSFTKYCQVIAEHLDIPRDRMLVCGMALGFADQSAPENNFRTERALVAEFTRFVS